MRVLVIGASGFLGRHVRRRAVAAGFDVVTAGRAELPDSPRHFRMDLGTDPGAHVAGVLAEAAPDVVVNCAGATLGDTELLTTANVLGTQALLRAMLLVCRGARLVHLGSAAEYGRGPAGEPVDEDTPPRPYSAYGSTKLAGTALVELARSAGLDAVVLRVFNPVGSGAPEHSLPGRVAAELRTADAAGHDLRLGPLDAMRDFVDARDVADAVLAAARVVDLPHPVLNIASGRAVPARALVKEMLSVSGATCSVYEDEAGSARSAGVPWQQGAITLALRVLSWAPRYGLAASVAELWRAKE